MSHRSRRPLGRGYLLGLLGATCALVAAAAATGCSQDENRAGGTATASASASAFAPGPQVNAPAPGSEPAGEPVCARSERHVWSGDINPRTGLTETVLPDGRVIVGIAVGDVPHALTVGTDGKAELTKLAVKKGSELDRALTAPAGVRHLQRVTVAAGNRTFADYRDKHQDGRRRIACGSTEGVPVLLYDGQPLIPETDGAVSASGATPGATAAPTATGSPASPTATAAAATASPTVASGEASSIPRLPRSRPGAPGATAVAKAPVGLRPAAPTTVKTHADGAMHELRDCRTFVDPLGNDVWGVGSELVGSPHADGTTQWKMVFFVAADGGARRELLHEVLLGKSPDKLHTLEAPVARQISSNSYVLAGRYRGTMFAWLLGADKKPRGSLMRYTGGYPSLPRIVADGDNHWLLTSLQTEATQWKLRAMQLGGSEAKLLATLTEPRTGSASESMAEPGFARVGKQRWLSYHQGERRRGLIVLVPVSDELSAEGRQFLMDTGDASVYESLLLPRADGKLMVLYIQRREGAQAELISEVLSCQAAL